VTNDLLFWISDEGGIFNVVNVSIKLS
jgi:hypothetical protein